MVHVTSLGYTRLLSQFRVGSVKLNVKALPRWHLQWDSNFVRPWESNSLYQLVQPTLGMVHVTYKAFLVSKENRRQLGLDQSRYVKKKNFFLLTMQKDKAMAIPGTIYLSMRSQILWNLQKSLKSIRCKRRVTWTCKITHLTNQSKV